MGISICLNGGCGGCIAISTSTAPAEYDRKGVQEGRGEDVRY